jgi:hypothetical protein
LFVFKSENLGGAGFWVMVEFVGFFEDVAAIESSAEVTAIKLASEDSFV